MSSSSRLMLLTLKLAALTEVELKEDCEELFADDENNDGKVSSSEVWYK